MKKVLVTGASRGIGLSIAGKLLNDNYFVTGTHFNTDVPDSLRNSGHFESVRINFEDPDELMRTMKPLLSDTEFTVLINNAGIVTDASITSGDDSWINVWDKTMQVNLKSAALLSKWFVENNLKSERKGILINIASRAAFRGDTQEYAAYAASKAGLAAFTKSIARNYSKKGILAYTIAPGFIDTDMAKASAELLGSDVLTKDTIFDEVTSPDEVANIVAFLARGEVSHMSGSTIHINGGSYML